jgi:hypothetical protein
MVTKDLEVTYNPITKKWDLLRTKDNLWIDDFDSEDKGIEFAEFLQECWDEQND